MQEESQCSFLMHAFGAMLCILLALSQSASAQSANSADADSAASIDVSKVTMPNTSTTATTAGLPTQSVVSSLANRVFSRDRKAPRREDRTAINLGNKHFNAIFGGLDQGAGIAFGLELTTADAVPGAEFRLMAVTSTKLYRRFEGTVYIPKIASDKAHAEIWFDYLRRTRDRFFGLGSRTNRRDKTNFDLEARSINARLYRDFTDHLQAGIYIGQANTANYRGQNNDELPIDVLFSSDPQVQPPSRYTPALRQNVKNFTYGGYVECDLRNDENGLTKGSYFYGRFGSADGLDSDGFSDYGWIEGQIDARGYIPLGSNKTSLALRTMIDLKRPKGGSQIPYYAQSYLGGRNFVRGYDNFRFYAHNLLLYAAELRQTVYTIEKDRGIDVAFFGDLGRVWGDTRSKTDTIILRNDTFSEAPWRAAYGAALQFRYSKAFAVRVDWGHSPERNHVYFSVSRGF